MKIPKKIKILGHYIDVVLQKRIEAGGSDSLGSSTLSRNRIFINTDQAVSQQESTLIHEIIEQINWAMKMNLTEETICQLESGIYQVLKDNHLIS